MNLTFCCGKTIRLVANCAPNIGQSEKFFDLVKFLGMSHLPVLLGDFNVSCEGCVDYVGSKTDKKVNFGFQVLTRFQMADSYRPEYLNAPL